jgi:outer membrane protein assembly factor BamA
VLFEDAGNIYSSLTKFSFRVDQRDLTDFNYMVHAAGFGVRYRTPVGPVRFDLAYSINPPKYNGFPGSYVAVRAVFDFQYLPALGAADQPLPVFLFDRAGVLRRAFC